MFNSMVSYIALFSINRCDDEVIDKYCFMNKVLGVDIQDDMGRHEVGYVEDVLKTPINENKGCRFRASFRVNKVSDTIDIQYSYINTTAELYIR